MEFSLRLDNSNTSANSVAVVASVAVKSTAEQSPALHYLRSFELKTGVQQRAISELGLQNYGMALSGGPIPVKDKAGKVTAYEQRFKLTKNL